MENVITFTPAELIAFITAIGGAAAAIGTIVTLIYKLFKKLREPEDKQNERMKVIENRLNGHDEDIKGINLKLEVADNQFSRNEESTKITQGALLALLKHSLNGDATEDLKKAEERLEAYLIQK